MVGETSRGTAMRRLIAASSAAAAVMAAAGAALAQDSAAEQALPTSNGPGWVDQDAKPVPGPVRTAPAKPSLYTGPLDRLAAVPRDNPLLNVHGSVGVMIGSHNTRAAFVDVHGPIGDRAAFALHFDTIHSDALPTYGGYGLYGGYGPYGRYAYGPAAYGPGTAYRLGAVLSLGGASRPSERWRDEMRWRPDSDAGSDFDGVEPGLSEPPPPSLR